MNDIKLSFIIPVYNSECYIEKCVEKILTIESFTYEVIIIDDGSTDNSSFICEVLCEKYKKVKVFHQSNKGVSEARNTGLEIATGEYVLFLDADDAIESNYLEATFMSVIGNPKIDMVIFGMSFDYFYNGNAYRRDFLETPICGIFPKCKWEQYLDILFESNSLSPIWNKIIKRDLIVNNSLLLRKDMFLYEDLEYSLRCMDVADLIMFDPSIIYHYRVCENEGNAGRRLKRVSRITTIVNNIDKASAGFTDRKVIDCILLRLFLILAKGKISVSSYKEIYNVCMEFCDWIKTKEISTDDPLAYLLINKYMKRIIMEKYYSKIKHCLAVRVKNTRVYCVWKERYNEN